MSFVVRPFNCHASTYLDSEIDSEAIRLAGEDRAMKELSTPGSNTRALLWLGMAVLFFAVVGLIWK